MAEAAAAAVETPAPTETVLTTPATPVAAVAKEPVKAEPAKAEPVKAEVAAAELPKETKTVVPEKYDLKVPEGSRLDPSAVEKIASFAKDKGLSNEQAQVILDREDAAVAGFVDRQTQELKAKPAQWKAEAQSDKEIGGEAFPENVEIAHRAITRFGSETLKQALNDSGLGNHPELIRAFYKIGKAMAEDKFVASGGQNADVKKSAAEVLYPSSK